MDNITEKPFAPWLEEVVAKMFEIEPISISLQMRDLDDKIYSSYWNCSTEDIIIFINALKEENMFDWIRNNKEEIRQIIMEDDEEEDIEFDDSDEYE